jgi:hypothetical protein
MVANCISFLYQCPSVISYQKQKVICMPLFFRVVMSKALCPSVEIGKFILDPKLQTRLPNKTMIKPTTTVKVTTIKQSIK